MERIKNFIETEEIEKLFIQFKTLYVELIGFKNKADFVKMGFGKGGEYNKWFEKIQELKRNKNSKLLSKKGVLIEELEQLGIAYVGSKGVETGVTKIFNKIFSDVILLEGEK